MFQGYNQADANNLLKIPQTVGWFKKNTEGALLMQWISYFMIFPCWSFFILEYLPRKNWTGAFFATVLSLGATLVINILWFQYPNSRLSAAIAFFIIGLSILLPPCWFLAAFAFTEASEIIFLLFMQTAQLPVYSGSGRLGRSLA